MSASAGSMSHRGRPNHARTCSRCDTSDRIVTSASPAAARARTNPASTSVSNPASSAGPAGERTSRRSRTTARLNPGLLAFTDPARSVLETIDPQKTRNHFRRQHQHDRRNNPQVHGLERLKGPQGTLGIFIRNGPGAIPEPRPRPTPPNLRTCPDGTPVTAEFAVGAYHQLLQ